jgi:hypothetical protein
MVRGAGDAVAPLGRLVMRDRDLRFGQRLEDGGMDVSDRDGERPAHRSTRRVLGARPEEHAAARLQERAGDDREWNRGAALQSDP